MPFVTVKDGTEIYYKDWGSRDSETVVFSHGWPLNSDNWENQMFFLANRGYRVVAHDRRGHGRSSQPWDGNNLDTFAEDLLQVIEHLDLKGVTLVGHSTGGGEIARFVYRYGTSRVKKAVLISALPPLLIQTESNPDGVPMDVFDNIRAGQEKDRSQFFIDFAHGPFFGFNRPGAKISQGLIDIWWAQGMQASFRATHECVKVWEEDQHEDLKRMDIPTLVLHGDDDQIVPIKVGGLASVKYLPKGTLKIYPGAPHALPNTHVDQVNKDLLEFLQS
jgi:non-heme chloroperoxidase